MGRNRELAGGIPFHFDINLVGTFTTIKYAVPHLRRRGRLGDRHVLGERHLDLLQFRSVGLLQQQGGEVALAKMLAVELGPAKIQGES